MLLRADEGHRKVLSIRPIISGLELFKSKCITVYSTPSVHVVQGPELQD